LAAGFAAVLAAGFAAAAFLATGFSAAAAFAADLAAGFAADFVAGFLAAVAIFVLLLCDEKNTLQGLNPSNPVPRGQANYSSAQTLSNICANEFGTS
jgi:fructose-specific phosphotransferase system IIC component